MFAIMVFDSDADFLFSIPLYAVTRTDPLLTYQKMMTDIYNSIGSDGMEEDVRQFKICIAEMISAVRKAISVGIKNMSEVLANRVYKSVMVCFFQQTSMEFVQRNNDGFDGQIIVPNSPSDPVLVAWTKRMGIQAAVAPQADTILWPGELQPDSSGKNFPHNVLD